MKTIVKKLCEAEGPDRELDFAMHEALGLRWCSLDGAESLVPNYTGSLDAALPGENIEEVKIVPAPGRTLWLARHRAQTLRAYAVIAKTEALARRHAALSDPAIGGDDDDLAGEVYEAPDCRECDNAREGFVKGEWVPCPHCNGGEETFITLTIEERLDRIEKAINKLTQEDE